MAVLEYHKKSNRIFSEIECHCHSVFEVYYFINGDCDIIIEGNLYKLAPHTLILLAPGVLHGIQVNSEKDYIRDVIYIAHTDVIPERLHLLKGVAPDIRKVHNKAFIFENAESFNLSSFYYNLKQLEDQPSEIKDAMEPIFIEALVAQINLVARTLKPYDKDIVSNSKVSEIIDYINLNLSDPLSLDLISSHFFISKNYLNKLFNQYLGTTVIEYIRYKRVVLAKQYMIQNKESAIDAALRVGFTDYSSFYRSYVKYIKSSPREDMEHFSSIYV